MPTIREYAQKFNLTLFEAFEIAWSDSYGRPCRCNQTRIDMERFERTRVTPEYVKVFESKPSHILRARNPQYLRGG